MSVIKIQQKDGSYVYITPNGQNTTTYVSNWYGDDNACVFGLIDRKNNKVKIWEFKTTGISDLLELDI